jgi:hypothetical protein
MEEKNVDLKKAIKNNVSSSKETKDNEVVASGGETKDNKIVASEEAPETSEAIGLKYNPEKTNVLRERIESLEHELESKVDEFDLESKIDELEFDMSKLEEKMERDMSQSSEIWPSGSYKYYHSPLKIQIKKPPNVFTKPGGAFS